MSKQVNRRRRAPALSLLSLALLGALSMPVLAADPVCLDANGNPTAPPQSTDQGSESGFENATCASSASAFGRNNNASGPASSAFGLWNVAIGTWSSAFGYANQAGGEYSSAFGVGNLASGNSSVSMGFHGTANGFHSLVLAGWFDRNGDGTVDANETARASGAFSVALGAGLVANGLLASAVGVGNSADGTESVAFGKGEIAFGNYSAAVGRDNRAFGDYSTAFGNANTATADYSSAFGYQSQALAVRSTALGYQAVAGVSGTVSFGHSATDLDLFGNAFGSELNARLTHVAAGTNLTDAVNLGQLNAAIAGIGGGEPLHFFSVNSTDSTAGNYANDGATGANAVAVGVGGAASGEQGSAFGYSNTASGDWSSAVGSNNTAGGAASNAFGSYNEVIAAPNTYYGANAFGSLGSTGAEILGHPQALGFHPAEHRTADIGRQIDALDAAVGDDREDEAERLDLRGDPAEVGGDDADCGEYFHAAVVAHAEVVAEGQDVELVEFLGEEEAGDDQAHRRAEGVGDDAGETFLDEGRRDAEDGLGPEPGGEDGGGDHR